MGRHRLEHIAAALLLVFASFYCGNTLFIHSHSLLDGERVVHSHPYLPGSHHSHSPEALTGLALLNIALSAMEAAKSPTLLPPATWSAKCLGNSAVTAAKTHQGHTSLRAPPADDYIKHSQRIIGGCFSQHL